MKIIYPDYNNCLTNVTNSILKYFDVKPYHNTLPELDKILEKKEYKNIILILYDGMGSNLLDNHLKTAEFLKKYRLKDISTVFPSTTTAATTSVLSGLNPNEHGWLGWDLYFKEINQTISMFLNTIKDTDEPASIEKASEKYFPYTSIIDLIKEKYKAYKVMPFGENAYNNLEDMHDKIVEYSREDGKKFIYAYLEEPDHTMHKLGTNSEETKQIFKKINDSTENLCNRLENSLVIIVADHGHLNCESITLSEYPDVFNLLRQETSIESRACAFFIKEGKEKEFEMLFNKYFGNDFKLYKKEDVIKNQLFGIGTDNKYFKDSLGDYLAVAIKNKYFRYNENSLLFKSMHAGLTEDEMYVPLIIYEA